ncbi:MAG: hypothetical protein ABI629_10865 [bacterium]
MRFVVPMLLAALAVPRGAQAGEETRAALAAQLRSVAQTLAQHADDLPDKHDAAMQSALQSAWTLLGRWTSGFLDRHPHASAADLLIDLSHAELSSDLDAGLRGEDKLSATAVRLRGGAHATYVVAPFLAGHGTFFVVARDAADGRFAMRWSVVPLATAYRHTANAIRRWAITGSGAEDGPMFGRAAALPPGRSGRPRFMITAHTVVRMGCSFYAQLGIWEWNGDAAVPLLVDDYASACDTPPVHHAGNIITVPTVEILQVINTCGVCTYPSGVWRVQLTPDGVINRGHTLDEPEIGVVDRFLAAVRDGGDVRALASPAIVDAARRMFGGADAHCLGMTDAYAIERHGGSARVKLMMDSCCGTEADLTLQQHGAQTVITDFTCH